MGQKVSPTGFRVGVIEDWRSRWYSDRDYAKTLENDLAIRKFLDSSPCRYQQERRIEMAKNMLLQPAVPIKYISESCGFHDIEVFYRNFKRLEGISPGNYREQNL